MKTLIWAAVAALITSPVTPVHADTCLIVTNQERENYWHELAHCNGWHHDPNVYDLEGPLEFVHPYDGKLVIYLTRADPFYASHVVEDTAQPGSEIIQTDKSAKQLCNKMWQARRISTAGLPIGGSLYGCAMIDHD
jgi:hypothetical protein